MIDYDSAENTFLSLVILPRPLDVFNTVFLPMLPVIGFRPCFVFRIPALLIFLFLRLILGIPAILVVEF